MSSARVVWIGSGPLVVPMGFDFACRPSLAAALDDMDNAEVIVISGVADWETCLHAFAGEVARGAKVIVQVPKRRDVIIALGAGASDAVPADAPGELLARVLVWAKLAEKERVRGADLDSLGHRVRQLEDTVTRLEHEAERLRQLAHRDELTGLGNRRSFSFHLEYALDYARRYGGSVALVLADLDGMKRINDALGHAAGDAALRMVAEVIRGAVRSVDHAARIGGDEFGIIMPQAVAPAAVRAAERIRERIAGVTAGGQILSVSIGVAAAQEPRGVGFAADELLSRADQALYRAKHAGKDRVAVDRDSIIQAA